MQKQLAIPLLDSLVGSLKNSQKWNGITQKTNANGMTKKNHNEPGLQKQQLYPF